MTVTLTIGRRKTTHRTLADAVAAHNTARDASGEGASTWPSARVDLPDGRTVYVSYNGRVWERPVRHTTNVEVLV